jgi:hypothetical protein
MISDFMRRLLAAMLVLSLGFALDITGSIIPNSATLVYGNGTSFDISITNWEPRTVDLRVTLTGIPTWMRIFPNSVSIPHGQTEIIKMYFSNSATPDSYIYRIQLFSNETSVWEGSAIVNVVGEGGTTPGPGPGPKSLKISAQAEVNPGETIIPNIEVSNNLIPSDVEIILLKDGNEVAKVSGSLDRSPKSFTLPVPESEEAGNYVLRAHLPGEEITNETVIIILDLEKVEIQIDTEQKLLGRLVTFTAKNMGNRFKEDQVVTEIGLFDRPLLEASPTPEITKQGMNYRLAWSYTISPGEEKVVATYTVDYIPYSIIVVLLLIAVVLVFQRPEPVEVKKHVEYIREGDNACLKIKLHVSNSSDETIENVVVKDLLPSIASVSKAFIVKPKVKKQKDGRLLRWELGKFLPGEERILAYEARLSYGIIGKLELPKPTVSWNR